MRLRTPQAAEYLGISARTLEKWRLAGEGPVYSQLRGPRGPVVYDTTDLDAYVAAGRRTSTSDPGPAQHPTE